MAKKRSGRGRKSKTRASKSGIWAGSLFKGVLALALLAGLVVAAAWLTRLLLPPPAEQAAAAPIFEIYSRETIAADPHPERPPAPIHPALPKVAIIVDDLGYDSLVAEKFLALDGVLTVSVLPQSPFMTAIAGAAHRRGLEIMLHQPMEPLEYPRVDPGPGSLLIDMAPDRLLAQLNANLDAIPFVRGVNNHMGSKMTAVSSQMHQIFTILKKRRLFFVDSRTTAQSLCRPAARLLRVPFAQRDVFLDHSQNPSAIRRQIDLLVDVANRRGEAVGIAHPYPATLSVLQDVLPELQRSVRLVPASQIVHIIG